jgi:PAS domain S-box-containing protein
LMTRGSIRDYLIKAKKMSGDKIVVMANSHVVKDEKDRMVRIDGMFTDFTARLRMEEHLKERMKELQAFFNLSEIAEREGITLENLYQELANMLPISWKHSEIACARIVIGDDEFLTKNFAESVWMQSAPVKVGKTGVGRIDVGYLEERPEQDEGPFLKEERQLIDAIAERLGHITARKRAEDALRKSESKFKRLYDSNIIGVIFWDTAGNIIQANGEFLRIVGYSEDDVLSSRARWKDMTPPEYAYLDDNAIKEMAETGICAPFEKEYIRKDGRRVPIRLNAALLKGEGDIGICFIQDITERKRYEEALKRTAADLERSNKELEQFAYVASHDLQEPLRMVSSYTQLLAQRYEGQLDDKAKKYINYAVDGAVRMQRLINDLLMYSRVGTRGKPFEPTDSHSVLGETLRNLQAAIEESQAIITNDDLPTVRADASQLAQVFQNLIGNAIKFRLDSPPHIHVSARDRGHEWVFSVADNGIGIDPQYKDRLFAIFQRLHTKQEYPGTGIGLALCKKIVERHGGRIWFESEPGKGSTFFFSIPK